MCRICEKYKKDFNKFPNEAEAFVIHKIMELDEWNQKLIKESEKIFENAKKNPQESPMHALLKLSFVGSIINNVLQAFHYTTEDKSIHPAIQLALSGFILNAMDDITEHILKFDFTEKVFKEKNMEDFQKIVKEHFKVNFEQN